jgi:hypothetical protein
MNLSYEKNLSRGFFVVAIIELRSLYLGKENDPSNNLHNSKGTDSVYIV